MCTQFILSYLGTVPGPVGCGRVWPERAAHDLRRLSPPQRGAHPRRQLWRRHQVRILMAAGLWIISRGQPWIGREHSSSSIRGPSAGCTLDGFTLVTLLLYVTCVHVCLGCSRTSRNEQNNYLSSWYCWKIFLTAANIDDICPWNIAHWQIRGNTRVCLNMTQCVWHEKEKELSYLWNLPAAQEPPILKSDFGAKSSFLELI